ncbi:VPS28 protein [Helicosporidium sp. ATCC 50920]|nr:VPS28 protein [Helicosporidium sp. ATCC 50920]|eukprot:KDD74910.1 VPS28 protein [Helicosporidium sp. ATCC 50920]
MASAAHHDAAHESVRALLASHASGKLEGNVRDEFADLFAILKATEKLERAFVRDAIPASAYEPCCQRLIAQFKTLYDAVRADVPDVAAFAATHNMQCPMALRRLVASGIPATVEHGSGAGSSGGSGAGGAAVAVAETVQHFITAMDGLKLNMVAVDQLFPLLSDLVQSLNRVPQLPATLIGKERTKAWLSKLHGMAASYELSQAESRQLLFELDAAYNEFMQNLPR